MKTILRKKAETLKTSLQILILIACLQFVNIHFVNAQDYVLNFSDPATYIVTCGKVTNGQWSVKNATCMLFTPYIRAEVENVDVSFSFKVNQSGNGDANDKGYVYSSLDGGDWIQETEWTAGGQPCVFNFDITETLLFAQYVQFIVVLTTDSKTEFWSIMDGGIHGTDGNDSEHNVETYNEEPSPDLPVDLISFTGNSMNDKIFLEWVTASETNNDYFVVEKSEDGISFNDIAFITGAGNSNNTIQYEFVDESPYETSFYRLRQTDYDGVYTVSETISVSVYKSLSDEIEITSSNGLVNIITNDIEEGNLQINIFTVAGSLVFKSTVNIEKGSNTISISPEIPGNSIYIINASLNEKQQFSAKIFLN
jgi:hypothetical protein